jgi:hypothetical protein
MNPPKKRNITGLAYDLAVCSMLLILKIGNNIKGITATMGIGNASDIQSNIISMDTDKTTFALVSK